MKVTGYSERGAVNSLFYELAYSGKALHLLEQFLSLVECPEFKKSGTALTDAHVLIEQSLSDFGDADAILLLEAGKTKSVVFLEVKVKSFQKEKWVLDQEFDNFKQGCGTVGKLSSSNLFTQLYHKSRLIDALRSPVIGINGLQDGIKFPECSTKRIRKIGNNRVVLSAINAINPYCENTWYFSLVPDKSESIRGFYDRLSSGVWPGNLGDLESSRWGGIAWEKVDEFCGSFNLKSTSWVLEFNKGQIY
jgi:hypothetical protein